MSTTQKLMAALTLWLELSEVDPNKTSFTVSMGNRMSTWDVKRMHDLIKEALELDDTNTTGVLMLDALSKVYFDNRSYTINQLLSDPDRTAAYVAKAATLRDMVRSPEFMAQNEHFTNNLRSALKTYAMESEKTLDLVNDLQELAYLRRDAFRSIQKLRVDQFLSGEPEPEGTRPVYNGWVHQFWNVNSLVEAACRQPSGVTLSLVRDPDDLQSYFVFAIRNGGNLYLLSDVPVYAHPLKQYMSRRPERDFASRTCRNWFPYDLLNLVFDEDAKAFFADETKRRSLVPQQQTIDRLKPISELDPQEVLWIVMMFDLIVEKFWHKRHQAPALSYTAAMIREELPLIDAAKSANLPVEAYKTLSLPPLTQADLTAENVAAAVGSDGGRPNAWLEARYADKVDPALFNLLDNGSLLHYLPPGEASKQRSLHAHGHKNHPLALISPSHVSVLAKDDRKLGHWDREGRYPLHAMRASTFGTREELENDRIFLARHNQAQAINRLADEEFHQRKADVVAWWTARVKQNQDYLLFLAAEGTVRRVFEPTSPGCCLRTADGYSYSDNTFHFVRTFGDDDDSYPMAEATLALHQGYIRGRDKFACVLTEAASSYRVLYQPQNATQLAELAGCEVHDLPDVLQHWSAGRDSQGNHILNRIDPMAWALEDPWCRISFRIVLFLSKRGLAQIKKRFPERVAAGERDAIKREELRGNTRVLIRCH